MLTHPTLDQLHALGLHGMAKGFKELDDNPEARTLEHPEWLALLLEHETTLRRQKRFEARARAARLRQSASIEDVDYVLPAASTVLSSASSLPANGFARAATSSLPGRAGW
jgi:hypothetical protein